MEEHTKYNIDTNIKFNHQEVIDIPSVVNGINEKWANRTLTKVNDSVVRIGVIEGEFHWHKHDNDDEFFYVVEGNLFIDLENRTLELHPYQGVTISKGVMHRPRAPQKVVMLMFETSAIQPTGD
jgi:mannose-6-phosphate isomerase-like protein (cupin superfamily)